MSLKTSTRPSLPADAPGTAQTRSASWAYRINHWFEAHWLLTFNTAWGVFVTLPWLAPIFMNLGWSGSGRVVYFIYNFFCHQLPERSWFLFGPSFSYSQAQIAEAWGRPLSAISGELVRRQFIGAPELGWKVAWSDRMVAMYGSIFLFGLLYAILREWNIRIKGIPWGLFLLLTLPLALDGTTHLINDAFRLEFRQLNHWAATLTGPIFPAAFYAGDAFGSLNSLLRLVTGLIFGFGIVAFLWPIMEKEFSSR